MVEWAGVVLAEPRVLEGMRVIDFMSLGEVEPEVTEGFPQDKFKLGKSV
jgi:hypothetical protein